MKLSVSATRTFRITSHVRVLQINFGKFPRLEYFNKA
jgi:hypothetical protein